MEENDKICEEIIKERIEENKELFSKEELCIIEKNDTIIKKIYLLGLINGRDVYGNNLQ